jgi:hypothetical protein
MRLERKELMKKIEIELYNYEELSDDAKKKVIEDIRSQDNYDLVEFFITDLNKSLHSIAKPFGGVRDAFYGSDYNGLPYIKIHNSYPDMTHDEQAELFLNALANNGYDIVEGAPLFVGVCGFSGTCYDEEILEFLWAQIKNKTTIYRSFINLGDKLCKMIKEHEEWIASDEYILESLDETEETYLKTGEKYVLHTT